MGRCLVGPPSPWIPLPTSLGYIFNAECCNALLMELVVQLLVCETKKGPHLQVRLMIGSIVDFVDVFLLFLTSAILSIRSLTRVDLFVLSSLHCKEQ